MELPESFCWDILDKYFTENKSIDSISPLVKHQIDSYNKFINTTLPQIISGFNPIKITTKQTEVDNKIQKININVLNPSLTKPIYQLPDGTQTIMTPYIARMNNLTYSSPLYVNVHIIIEYLNEENITVKIDKYVNNVYIGKIPIMVRSNACVLHQLPAIGDSDNNECRYDYGGYFIVNGNEKVLIMQDRINENDTLIFQPNNNSDGLYAEIRSMNDSIYLPPKTTSLNMSGKLNHMGRSIRLNTSFIRSEIPVFIMFRALGIISDKEIIQHIVYDLDNKDNQRIICQLMACCDDASDIHTQEQAEEVLTKIMTGVNKTTQNPSKILRDNIINDFLPHVGKNYRRKALYLGYMIRKMIRIYLGYDNYDNRDSYMNKRIDSPGILLSNLFRQCYGKMSKEIKGLIERELNLWRANYNNTTTDIINDNNIHRYFKQSLLDSWLKYSLSTGNWGIKSIGSFQNIKQGVSQVLNRMSYASTLSHLRRISTSMEKNGKLVQPRKLDNSQFNMICPAECFHPDTPILLWNGSIKKASDIIIGDYLIDDNGNAVRVKSTCSGIKRMYEVIQHKNNFMNYIVTDNHILTLKVKKYKTIRNHNGKKELSWFDKKELTYKYKKFNNIEDLYKFSSSINDDDDIIDITIEQYLSLAENVKKQLYTFKSNGINWDTKEVELDPYILGLWLGDRLSSGYGFITADEELLDMWIKWGKNNDATIKKNNHKYRYTISSTINNTQTGISCNKTEEAPLKKILKKYNLVKNKHIPLDYLINDRKTRLAVLAGLIDTDGNVRANGHEIRISQGKPNYKIIYDAEFLARSLGFSCHLNDGVCSYTVNGEKRQRPYKELTITGKYLYEIPTILNRKKLNKCNNPTHEKRCSSYLQSSFELVENKVQPFVGWQLDGNGRFLLGDMSVSHNTPEGASVGLVKNLALSTIISISMSSTHIRELLVELGTNIYDDSYSYVVENNDKWHIETDAIKEARDKITNYFKELGNSNNVYVQINGDIIGYHTNPLLLYNTLKHYKRCGIIYPMTSVYWNILKRCICISTDAGRMYRPLLIVDYDDKTHKTELRINRILREKKMSWKEFAKGKTFDNFICPNNSSDEEGFIEYLDNNELNHTLIAINHLELGKGMKGNSYPPRYTNCEIHASLMNGILGVNIPFSDHNQSPRNCYQCLNENEKVLLSNGNYKLIKEIIKGDEVICFNPITNFTTVSKVVNHYHMNTSKIVYNIQTITGRTIIATYDHKFMTMNGWVEVMNFNENTNLGIHMMPDYMSSVSKETIKIIDNEEILKFMNKASFDNNDYQMPIVSRLAGYCLKSNYKFNFENEIDNEEFMNDIIAIGFNLDSNFRLFISIIIDNIDTWLIKSSDLVKREFVAGYMYKDDNDADNNIDDMIIEILDYFNVIDDNSYYRKIGIRYNYEKLKRYAMKNEYDLYNNYNGNNDNGNSNEMTFEKFSKIITIKGKLIFIPFHRKIVNYDNRIADLEIESSHHSFIGGNDGFAISNCAMGKQALGIFASNFTNRIDTMGHIINYPQKPIVSTKLSKYTNSNELPSGVNAIIAIMTHSGFNQEDSVMINKSALDRGLFVSTYYKAFRDQCAKNHSSGEEEIFTNPIGMTTIKPSFSYEKLDETGFVPKNTYIDGNDIIVGKVMPRKMNGKNTYSDNSTAMKANDDGYIDYNYIGTNSDGYKFCKIRIRKNRKPEVGDKVASRSAQKGSIGMIYEHQDMPFTKDGIVPDIIINPHAIPSRMTMAQLMECIMGKVSCHLGAEGDATPFNNCGVENIARLLEKTGLERHGNEIMYNGRTGEQIKTEIFIGPTYYQRLKHMVADKIHSRGNNGPIVMLTRQCSEGRARGGGLRLGEMERDCFIGHGTASFLKEKMLDCADNYRVFICKECGMIANVNPDRNIYKCNYCKNATNIVQIRIPYAFKLLTQELYTMNVVMRYNCSN
jgi:DNA-directed RNA polymerase beta subunit